MDLIKYGETGLLVNWEQVIDPNVNQRIFALNQYLNKTELPGIKTCIPAYCSLTIIFDPLLTSHHELSEHINALDLDNIEVENQSRKLIIPVCYANEMGLDLIDLSKVLNLSVDEIITIHTHSQYQIYMMGFLPGFSYMGILDEKINSRRKAKPRIKVPSRSIAIAGLQTGIYPIESPGGWNIIGRTPIPVFDNDEEDPFLFELGDQIKFKAISTEEYSDMEESLVKETFDPQSLIYVD